MRDRYSKSLFKAALITLFVGVCGLAVQAREKVVIKGELSCGGRVDSDQWVYLCELNRYSREIPIDSVHISDLGAFELSLSVNDTIPRKLYFLRGPWTGAAPLFVEGDTVRVTIEGTALGSTPVVSGGDDNEILNAFLQLSAKHIGIGFDLSDIIADEDNGVFELYAGSKDASRASSLLVYFSSVFRLVLDGNDSPLSPMLMEHVLLPLMSKEYAERLSNALRPELMGHPYRISLENKGRSLELLTGSLVPNVMFALLDGSESDLNDYKGRYVLLHFLDGDDLESVKQVEYLRKVFDETVDSRGQLAIVTFSLDGTEEDWQKSLADNRLDRNSWTQVSDLLGDDSPAPGLFGLSSLGHCVLIDPDGRLISASMSGDEMSARVKQILGGDLYYQGEQKDTPFVE